MSEEDPGFSILWRQVGKKRWKEEGTSLLSEARDRAQVLDDGCHEVLLYENNVSFKHENEEYAGSVLVWWSGTYKGAMQCEPDCRGAGWSDEVNAFVEYDLPIGEVMLEQEDRLAHETLRYDGDVDTSFATELSSGEPTRKQLRTTAKSNARYVEVACFACGAIVPQNEAIDDTIDIKTGRTSGTNSVSRSVGRRTSYSTRGVSYANSSRTSARVTSGRSFYATEQVFFCSSECQFAAQSKVIKDRPALEQIAFYSAEFFRRLMRG